MQARNGQWRWFAGLYVGGTLALLALSSLLKLLTGIL